MNTSQAKDDARNSGARVAKNARTGADAAATGLRPAQSLLTIAGSDPSGGAGLQADLRVFDHFGFHGLSAITALTAQNTRTVDAVFPVDPEQLRAQLDVILDDVQPVAAKTGMLATVAAVDIVAEYVGSGRLGKLIVDPVLYSSAGPGLAADPAALARAIAERLLPLCDAVTPNLREASLLTGMQVGDIDQAKAAAVVLVKGLGARRACVTGGHLPGEPVDAIYDGTKVELVKEGPVTGSGHDRDEAGKRNKGGRRKGAQGGGAREVHGSGCHYSAALTARLASGDDIFAAARAAQAFTARLIAGAVPVGRGMRILLAGPPGDAPLEPDASNI